MRQQRIHRLATVFGVLAALLAWATPDGTARGQLVGGGSPPVLSISDDIGSFTLTFSNFLQGSVSSTQEVAYRIQANNMMTGSVQGVVSARLQQTFSGIDLEVDVTAYQNLGVPSSANLQESVAGRQVVNTTGVSLANKTPGNGNNDKVVDGNLGILWQARLTGNVIAGSRTTGLVVTLKDGN